VADVEVVPNGPRSFRVEVHDERTTTHLVEVPTALLEQLGLEEHDAELLVRESFDFLLEREPATSIMSEFSLDVIERYFPEYREDLGRRLS
jgi:hypothetical protein